MGDISRVALFGKLNSLGYKAIEGATVFCKLRGNPYVEVVHWLHQILQQQNSDLHCIVRAFSIDPGKLARDMTEALDRLPRGATSISDLSPHIPDAVERAWVWATLKYGETQVRTGHVVVAMLKTPSLKNLLAGISREFDRIKPDELADDFDKVCAGSPEAALAASDGTQFGAQAAPGEVSEAMPPAQMGKQEALKRFTVDLTEQARSGKLDPIVGRDEEIRQIIDILMRRRQNNPILTGEAGVGKTAVVEGFAFKIVSGDVPPPLRDVTLRALDVGLLQAGASMKGEFEQRLRSVIEEVQASPKPIIMFIDEAHTLVGAGGAAGTGDAANLLKPALARGTLRTVAATTWAEYKKHIEKDPALTRRFQVVQVHEPERGKGDPDDARPHVDDGEAPQGAGARRGARSVGAAFAPLHPGAAAARQVGEPARHGLRARRDQPARRAARGRRLAQAHRGAGERARDHRPRNGGGGRYDRTRDGGATGSWTRKRRGSRSSTSVGAARRRWWRRSSTSAASCAAAVARSKVRRARWKRRQTRPRKPHRPRRPGPRAARRLRPR